MASPAQVIHARVEAWRPVLVGGGTVKEKCTAEGTGPDDFRAQIADTRMQNARVRKSPGKKFSVEVKPTELLGLTAVAEVKGPRRHHTTHRGG